MGENDQNFDSRERPRETDDVGIHDASYIDLRGPARDAFGHPPGVVDLVKNYDWVENVFQFGDLTCAGLKQEIRRFWSPLADLNPDWVKLGLGSMAVMERNNKIFIRPGTKVLGSHPQFVEYVEELRVMGADYHAVPLEPADNLKFNTSKFISEIKADYRMIYLDNPNNPTGQLIPTDEVEEIVKVAAKKDIIVMVDEAYADCVDMSCSAMGLVGRYPNLIVLRSFTKGYGLAGIRVGYGIYPGKLSDHYAKVDTLLPIPAIASRLAEEALKDRKFLSALSEQVQSVKRMMIKGLMEKGYIVPETDDRVP
ncbi:MAG: histidinol-phosphate aminotransferase family protein, partial [Deltaproteobacteria bacterium]|nr:histidinol-phosphate aminotransferase family protein [Deltaproteobacteria bacterium]